MKNLNLVFNVVLLVAVVILFILVIRKPEEDVKPVSTVSKTIAYVNSDTLWDKYEFVKEIKSEIDSFESGLQKQYEVKAKAFQADYEDFVKKGQKGLLSQVDQERIGGQLSQRNQDLMALQQDLNIKLQNKTMELNSKVQDTIFSFLKRLNKKTGYSYIMQYSKGGTILVANDSLEITKKVVEGLNKEYEKFKK